MPYQGACGGRRVLPLRDFHCRPASYRFVVQRLSDRFVDIETALKADEATLLANDVSLKASSLDAGARKDFVSAKAYRAQFQATEGHVAAKRAAAHIAVGPYFAVKGLNFFRYFAGKGAKFRENFEISLKISLKFCENFEISLKFL